MSTEYVDIRIANVICGVMHLRLLWKRITELELRFWILFEALCPWKTMSPSWLWPSPLIRNGWYLVTAWLAICVFGMRNTSLKSILASTWWLMRLAPTPWTCNPLMTLSQVLMLKLPLLSDTCRCTHWINYKNMGDQIPFFLEFCSILWWVNIHIFLLCISSDATDMTWHHEILIVQVLFDISTKHLGSWISCF